MQWATWSSSHFTPWHTGTNLHMPTLQCHDHPFEITRCLKDMVDSGKYVESAIQRYISLLGGTLSVLKNNVPRIVDHHPIFPYPLLNDVSTRHSHRLSGRLDQPHVRWITKVQLCSTLTGCVLHTFSSLRLPNRVETNSCTVNSICPHRKTGRLTLWL